VSAVQARIARLKKALAEMLDSREHFSDDTVREIIRAVNEKIALLENSQTETLIAQVEGDQIRLVSVMFIDVENSTRLAQSLGEDWKPLLDAMHSRVARIVDDWGGEVGQYLGDGLLCFFGAHHSRGDDAVRAVGCAQAIQDIAVDFASGLASQYGERFALRVGISTGRVVVGVIGTAAKREVAAVGSTTNLAARLQHLCPPGQILVDDETYFQVRERYLVQPQKPVKLKGFDTPLNLYVVTGKRETSSFTEDQIAGIELPFMGRQKELQTLLQLWDDALAEGAFHAVTLYGDVGLGKSRLLQEVVSRIRESRTPPYIVTLSAEDDRRMGAYALLRQLLTELCYQISGDRKLTHTSIHQCVSQTWRGTDAGDAATILSRLIGVVSSDEAAPIPMDPLETAARWLLSLAGDRPLLLVVDNLTQADHTSLDLLEFVALTGMQHPGLILSAARPDLRERRPQFMTTATRLTEMTLGRLPNEMLRRLITTVMQHVDSPPNGLVSRLCGLADGNPLFVEEYLRMLFDSHVFVPDKGGRWRTNQFLYRTLEASLPHGLMGVFQARLDDLSLPARRVVQVASVIGATFWEHATSHLAGYPTQTLLDELVQHGIFSSEPSHGPNGQPNYHFRHTLYREVAYSMLTRPDREAYHRRTAEWLLRWVDHVPEWLPLRAEHLAEGQKQQEALDVYVQAAADRIHHHQFQDALKLIEKGLACATDIPRQAAIPGVSRLWLWQAYALNTLRRHAQASAAAQAALMLLDELPKDAMREERAWAAVELENALADSLE
jgi:class 3 adenylate cyclase